MQLSKQIILASGSPRRKEILSKAGFVFEVLTKNISENYPQELLPENVAEYLAHLKATSFSLAELQNKILITADTVVICKGEILGKPENEKEAEIMLQKLSGQKHTVITGVCIKTTEKTVTFSDKSDVYFMALSPDELKKYIISEKPLDKAGSYGIQDWIGLVGIEKISGSFYNVMGLPIHLVYRELKQYEATFSK
jgi:septum formation protein